MNSRLLHLELLKFLLVKSKSFGYIEVKTFLLKKFPEKLDFTERKEMMSFLKFLSEEGYIELDGYSVNGLGIIKLSGQKIKREDIAAKVKIKAKGVELVEQFELKRLNKVGIIFSVIFGITTVFFLSHGVLNEYNLKKAEDQNTNLINENFYLKAKVSNLKIQHIDKNNKKEK